MEIGNPPEIIANEDEVAAAELPAPLGWKKKVSILVLKFFITIRDFRSFGFFFFPLLN